MPMRLSRTIFLTLLIAFPLFSRAQDVPSAPEPKLPPPSQPLPTASMGVKTITLQDALNLARKNSPAFMSAVTDAGLAREDAVQARDNLLPSANFNTSAIYTQSNNIGGVIYLANNGVHEYVAQGDVHQQLGVGYVFSYRSTAAMAAAAKARAEIASRGLVVTVVTDYFGLASAVQKLEAARRIYDEGEKFFQLTQNLEKGGEVAHSDVIKAELQFQDRRRQLQEAQLALLNARLTLAVILFPNFNENYEIADDLHASAPLPPRAEFEAQAATQNPDIRAAEAVARANKYDVFAARAGYLPTITLDYFYGIDASHYATHTPANPVSMTPGFSNLGSSYIASLNLPVWNWGATQSKVRQAELKRKLANVQLSFAQRNLLAEMRSLHSEAETALNQLSGLQRSSELAAESLRLITLRYQNGESTVLEVVDAQTTYATATNAYHDGAVRYRIALANLQTLTGVLTTP
jgi:outer membrane protein TolC